MAETKPTGAKKHITGARIAQEIKQYKKDALISPLYTVCCVILEILIPYLTASIIDKGIGRSDNGYIMRMCGVLVLLGAVGGDADKELEVLQGVVDNENADEATKAGALQEIKELAAAMEAEANIESLVLAKGFSQCVAVINGDTCSVVVNGTELMPQQISQINEIVYEQAGILPANIRIITK